MSQEPRNTEHDVSQDAPEAGPADGKREQPAEEDLAAAFVRETEVIEESIENGKKVRRKGIYLLPNLFTTSALFAGFFSVVAGINGDFTAAAVAIFIAMVLDGLDGRVARLTNTQSAFGAEYDSLSDMLSFGVAPALVAFTWILQDIGKTGWVVAFLYVACAALRLARFNVQLGSVDKKWFIGLPSPSAAAFVAASVWTFHSFDAEAFGFKLLMLFVVATAGILMVSNIRYYSFKEIDLKGPVPFVVLLAIVLGFVVISVEPSVMLLLLFGAYVASGPTLAAMRKMKHSPPSS
ncbi:CDP-diacylglycerol--serine O-phosphatidyltransferase [Halomonas daqingensis]|uniref:CDP-diacylglycerol--serine O-phosphatidyltransferase n=1 Tax=Billgrantia desiderata TaxID=52021 RepID=A0AAW4YXG9_9GAMM|nr:CDP-diacylglycerol--serine O-phosphatidyltransferase [Halomonas desiderata]MCE8012340.1 CDP-diacylglycerol--serine O-phosphatidyltransferase [Halomonas desiderata]MCE8031020.1 CDP-diacylglycerol--serine O-phosphatidyltransferase [Halomonas desiderata]MCE8052875.1 CDP-diacylglycerol--serine O-phosphatidyltransferase [Halomonas desiderata]NIC38983.1 CDP-diacylglycerol--serine O-phosphatidyltransferase [Halomonas desiderata]SEG41697.1 CDP-diacylglycerol---serine O-phosphatidyltransferase [Halo